MSKAGVMTEGAGPRGEFAVAASSDDRLLVKRVQEGDTDAFGLLVEKYQRPLFNAALRMLGDGDEAQDVVQSAFVRAYDKLGKYKPQYKFFSWVYRITVNLSLNVLAQRRPQESLDIEMASPALTPEQEFELARLAERVQGALLQVAPHYREALVLRHFLDLSYREMAEVLNVPEKTVKSRLFTARRLLAGLLFGP